MPAADGTLLAPKRVAELLGISRRTLYNWVRRGFFPPPIRMGPTGRILRWTPTQIVQHLKAIQERNARREAAPAAPPILPE